MASVRRGDAAQSAAGRRARSALYLDRAGVLMAGDDPIADEGETTVVVEKRPLWLRVLKWIGVAILGLVVLVAAILLGLNTGPGKRFLVNTIGASTYATGLNVKVGRIEGSIYGRMVLRAVRVRDPKIGRAHG